MNYPDSVRFLYALGNETRTAKLGLDAISRLARELGDPQRAFRKVHVAGTNGKGSTCAMIAAGLQAAGFRTGLFTSPHLAEPTERIRIDGVPVPAAEFAEAFDRVHAAAERLIGRGELELHTTYFETVTAMAFEIFRDRRVDWAVLEVGLGGRLDATNILVPELSVITPVDYDHEAHLGVSLESIATEKAGIIKPGVPVVVGRQRSEAMTVIESRARVVGAPMDSVAAWSVEDCDRGPWSSRFVAAGPVCIPIDCPLGGEHQVENAVTAAAALHRLGVDPRTIQAGIRRTRWPGRLERIRENPDVILDGAHNPAAARALAAWIERFWAGRRVCLIYGAMRDKAVSEMAGVLFPLAAEIILTAPAQARAARPETLREISGFGQAKVAATLDEALDLARAASPCDALIITGSLFLVGEARRKLALQ